MRLPSACRIHICVHFYTLGQTKSAEDFRARRRSDFCVDEKTTQNLQSMVDTRSNKQTPPPGRRGTPRRSPLPAVVSVDSDAESTHSLTSNGTVRSKIPKHILKQLFYDIEHAGGIQDFDDGLNQALNILLDQGDPAIYGIRGDATRKRLSNKVTQWKSLSNQKYYKRLFGLGVVPAVHLGKNEIVRLKAKSPKKRSKVASIPEEVEGVEVDSPSSLAYDPKRGWATDSDAVTQQILERARANRNKRASDDIGVPDKMRCTSPASSCFVQVLAHPLSVPVLACPASMTLLLEVGPRVFGDQGEGLHVHQISFKVHNVMYEGIEISVLCDPRDVAEDLYDFSFKEGTNEARFSKPVMAAPHRLDKDVLDPRILRGDPNHGYIIDGRDAARTGYEKAVQKKGSEAAKKTYDVLFPDGYKLSQRAFGHPIGKDDEFCAAVYTQYLYRKAIGAGIRVGAGAVEPETYTCQLTWRFANAAKATELTVAAAPGRAAVAASLNGL